MTLSLRPVEPACDADLLHAWVSQERARFWGMTDKTRDEVEEIYGYIDAQPHLAAYLVLLDGTPVALFQTYDPFVDEIGAYYVRRPGDLGVHFFTTPDRLVSTGSLVEFLLGQVFADPAVQRVVVEPDARNDRAIARMVRAGAELGPRVDLPHKTAQFAFIQRPR